MKRMIEWAALSEHIRQRALAAGHDEVDYSTVLDVLEWLGDAPWEDATEARVLTWDELYGFDGAVLVEYNPDHLDRRDEWMFVDYLADTPRPTAKLYRRHGEMESYRRSGYGKSWRAWSARPTVEEREAVKWE